MAEDQDLSKAEYEDEGSEFLWCLHCEKAVHNPSIDSDGDPTCPYCGAGPLDLWDWQEVKQHHPDYPEVPEDGKVYPLYD